MANPQVRTREEELEEALRAAHVLLHQLRAWDYALTHGAATGSPELLQEEWAA